MSAGYCPYDVNSGIIELIGPISQTSLKSIENRSSPFTISFAPRTTVPTLVGNRVEETSENTITLKADRYSLIDVQICSPTHKGYILPFMNEQPVAELILSFSPKSIPSSLQQLSGVLLCIPIYDTGFPSHHQYLSQLINADAPSCNYTNQPGSDYVGRDYNQIPNASLLQCINSCCNDPKCMAYTHNSGTCYLKNSIPNLVYCKSYTAWVNMFIK
jgi:PAN domain